MVWRGVTTHVVTTATMSSHAVRADEADVPTIHQVGWSTTIDAFRAEIRQTAHRLNI